MKKLILLICVSAFVNVMGAMAQTTPAPKAALNGEALLATSDCLVCHKLHEKSIGPAYDLVAAKYKPTDANITALADKIIKGGAGVWGDMPMTPHPTLKVDDVKAMVKYILTVKPEPAK